MEYPGCVRLFTKPIVMADMQIATGSRHTAPRVDLTPMVDLGFLLITFFMFTTSLNTSKALQLNMPSKEITTEPPVFAAESTITLLPGANHRVAYYEGAFGGGKLQSCPLGDIRPVLLRKKQQAAQLPANFSAAAHQLHVLIHPADGCTYGDVVALLDEVLIVGAPYYALTDITTDEATWAQGR